MERNEQVLAQLFIHLNPNTMEGKARLSLTSSINAHRVATCDKKLFDILRDDLLFLFFFFNFFKVGLC